MKFAPTRDAHVLITGATGFVGKVVLEELLRRRLEFGIEQVYVFVRSKKGHKPEQRFQQEIASSQCFSLLTDDQIKRCRVVAGELTQPDCGLSTADLELLADKVTHIVHVAASIEFDLPLHEAAASNITSALNMLDVARKCRKLKQMVSVSTAYVTPHDSPDTPVREELVKLPFDPEAVYQSILDGTASQKKLMAQTGHPNTYTFTKCIAEHLLHARKGDIPLCIVRPSVVSATWQHPLPGWIDSAAAFAGFILLIGAGHMRVLTADPNSLLDIVPCDVVSDRVLDATFGPQVAWDVRYAVASKKHSNAIGQLVETIVQFFRRHPVDRRPHVEAVMPMSTAFRLHELRLHRVPGRLVRTWAKATGQKKLEKMATRVGDKLKYVNRAFPYFTSKTFDFQPSRGIDDPAFNAHTYAELCCLGAYRHLMKRDETQMSLAGRKHKDSQSDWAWALAQPEGNWAIRTFALTVRKALRQITHEVTFDRASFARAVADTEPGSLHVLVPSHRSYLDFLLCSYLFFARPDLGIRIPHIAAAEEFSRIPVLGELFKKTHAFYLRRGLGKADDELTRHVHQLVAQGETIQFFIEGARSRSRQFLPPRHGLLRSLQSTGQSFTVLPISLTYDRVPEETALVRELRGEPRPEMQLRALLAWAMRMAQGDVKLGRVHLKCGEPVVMRPDTDVRQVARTVVARLQEHTATSTHHIRAFLQRNRLDSVSAEWLRDALERRGGLVIDSPLELQGSVDPVTELSMRWHWMHLWYPEARALWPDHPVVQHHTAAHGWHMPERQPSDADLRDPRVHQLLRALFEPVARDYATVAASVGQPPWPPRHASARSLLHDAAGSHLPYLQAAFDDLAERGVLVVDRKDGAIAWGPHADQLAAYREACVWPEDRTEHTTGVAKAAGSRSRLRGA
jgi:1-acyl-sn-glycerol-3-phosphate acyltransferase